MKCECATCDELNILFRLFGLFMLFGQFSLLWTPWALLSLGLCSCAIFISMIKFVLFL